MLGRGVGARRVGRVREHTAQPLGIALLRGFSNPGAELMHIRLVMRVTLSELAQVVRQAARSDDEDAVVGGVGYLIMTKAAKKRAAQATSKAA